MSKDEYRLGYRGDIEGLRAIAIMLVIAAHAGVPWLAGGFVGVDVFFVLSGFLITGLLLKDVADTGGIRFGDFYLRRLRRLFPALLTMVGLVSLAAALLLAPGEQLEQAKTAAAAVFWVSNIHFALAQLDYFSAGSDSNLFLHTWSLGVEEQFYLLWPALVLWALGRKQGLAKVAHLKAAMLGVVVLSLGACLFLTPKLPQLAFYMMPMRAWQFAMGALIWLYFGKGVPAGEISHLRKQGRSAGYWLGWLGLALVLLTAVVFNPGMSYPGWRALVPTLGAAAVVASGFSGASRGVSWLLAWGPLQTIGRVSYAWYLWHWPALLFGAALTGSHDPWLRIAEVLIALVLAVVSYRYIESPIRHQNYWLRHGRMVLFGAFASMAAASLLAKDWYTDALLKMQSPDVQRYAKAHADAPAIYGMGCDEWYHSDRVVACSFGQKDALHTAVLMGDSIGGQWFPAFAEIFHRPDWQLIVLTKSSCPMVDESFFYERIGREYTECSVWRKHALEQLKSAKPDIVVLGMAATYWSFTQEQWIEGTARVLRTLSPVSGHIYVMRGTPHLPFDGPNCLSVHKGRPAWLGASQACAATVSDEHGQQVFQWLQVAASRYSNVRMLDMNDLICSQGVCSAESQGRIVFRDSQHLTASYAESMAPDVAQRMGLPDVAQPWAIRPTEGTP